MDDDLRAVEAIRYDAGPWTWRVGVAVAEFLRDDPLEDELRQGVEAALAAVPDVTEVAEEDREVWVVQGKADGRDLVRSVGTVVDGLAERAERFLAEP